jgi:hypothetical protein
VGESLLASHVEDVDSVKAERLVFQRGGEDDEEDVKVGRTEEGED